MNKETRVYINILYGFLPWRLGFRYIRKFKMVWRVDLYFIWLRESFSRNFHVKEVLDSLCFKIIQNRLDIIIHFLRLSKHKEIKTYSRREVYKYSERKQKGAWQNQQVMSFFDKFLFRSNGHLFPIGEVLSLIHSMKVWLVPLSRDTYHYEEHKTVLKKVSWRVWGGRRVSVWCSLFLQ